MKLLHSPIPTGPLSDCNHDYAKAGCRVAKLIELSSTTSMKEAHDGVCIIQFAWEINTHCTICVVPIATIKARERVSFFLDLC